MKIKYTEKPYTINLMLDIGKIRDWTVSRILNSQYNKDGIIEYRKCDFLTPSLMPLTDSPEAITIIRDALLAEALSKKINFEDFADTKDILFYAACSPAPPANYTIRFKQSEEAEFRFFNELPEKIFADHITLSLENYFLNESGFRLYLAEAENAAIYMMKNLLQHDTDTLQNLLQYLNMLPSMVKIKGYKNLTPEDVQFSLITGTEQKIEVFAW